MASSGIEVARAYVTIIPSLEGSQKTIGEELGVAVDKEGAKAGKSLGSKLVDGAGSVLKTGAKVLGTMALTAVTAATASIVGITKQAVESFADFEQLEGGVKKLFGDDVAETVKKNAANAFQSAGLSANEYMETVTGFSASLISSLGGDTEKAAEIADMAIRDMSDNANTFGTSMESIQNAYAGFAKGQFNMLDNLKLGYGGTKEEMQRLLEDAEAISGVKYDISSYSDIAQAINVIQTDLKITGTTADEALRTISGSVNATKASWTNFVTALAGGGDITEALDGLKMSIFGVEGASNGLVNNVIPVIQTTISSIISVLPSMVSSLLPTVITTIQGIIPQIVALATQLIPVITSAIEQLFGSGFTELLNSVVGTLPDLVTALLNTVPTLLNAIGTIVTSLINAIVSNLPNILKSITSMIPTIIQSLLKNLVSIVTALVQAIPQVLVAVIEAVSVIVDMLPEIIQMIIDILPELLMSIINALIGNLPMIIDAIVTLATSILEALPDILIMLVDAIPMLVINIVDAIMQSLPSILVAIVNLVGQIVLKLPSILLTIANQFYQLFYVNIPATVISAFVSIVTALWNGLLAVIEKIAEFEKIVIDWIVQFLGDIIIKAIDFFTEIFDKVKSFFTTVVENVKTNLNTLFTNISTVFTNILNKAKEIFNNIKTAITTPIDNAKTTIINTFNNIKSTVGSVIDNIKSKVTTVFNGIKTAITSPIDTAKNLVSNAVQTMKNIFGGSWPLPKIKLPHFTISGSFNIAPPRVPKLTIDWYAKGYDQAQILTKAAIFGVDNSGNFLAGGEKGNEIVVGEEHLIDLISENVKPTGETNNITVNIYASENQDEETLARLVIEKIQDMTNSKEVVYA